MGVRKFISMAEMREARHGWHKQDLKVALVPTMGALHEGHLRLIEQAKTYGDVVLVTIFVNPKQFGPGEDFAKYPRTLPEDLEKLGATQVEAVFLPTAADMYPHGFQTNVQNSGMSRGLCGSTRPGHFDGVLTVVMKLFNITQPHFALFGKKDYQQFRIINRMVEDLDMPVEVIGCDTVREADGLAKSSRNVYLSKTERQQAVGISRSLSAVRDSFKKGERSSYELCRCFENALKSFEGVQLEYFEIRSQTDLDAFEDQIDQPAVALVAARVGSTRLIDNIELDDE